MTFLTEQINKRNITNQKTIMAFLKWPTSVKQSARQDPVPPWLRNDNEGDDTDQQNETSEDFEKRKRELEEQLKKYRK
jgi:hypothetical protein